MAVKTWDTSRTGGGTYELHKDENTGNYSLKSVGFAQVNKLNLPDLKTSDSPVKKILPVEDEKKTEVADPYKKLFKQTEGGGGGGGQDYSGVMLKTPEVKDAEVRQAGDPMVKYSPTEYNKKWVQDTQIPGVEVDPDKAGNWRENVQIPGTTTFTDPNYKSPTMAMKEQEFAQGKYTPKATSLQKPISKATDAIGNVIDSVKNNKAIQVASNVLGFVANPIMGGVKMVASMLPKDSPQNTFDRGYFPTTDVGRINLDPANNVFGGKNVASYNPITGRSGNLSQSAQKRIDTRNSPKTQARISKLSPERQKAFNDKTKEFEKQKKDYDNKRDNTVPDKGYTRTAAQRKANPGRQDANTMSGGSDSAGGNTRVICTDLHRTKELSTRDWIRDTKFTFKQLSKTHVKGYLLWAEPTVRHIQKYPRYRKLWKHFAQHRANDIAWRLNEGKFDLLGRIYAGIGEPLCWALGNFVSDKQISKYNLTHWRRV